jgi:hypothetical protein
MDNMNKRTIKKNIMENLKELELSEMVQISGGENVAYEIGYALGKAAKRAFFLITLSRYF